MIWIRADGNSEIGIGHIMRCISIAEEIKCLGNDVCFILADESVSELLNKIKMQYMVLHTEYNYMENELEKLEELLRQYKPDLLLIDSYSVTYQYLCRLKQIVKTAYMDDLGGFLYPANILINYNIYAMKEMYAPNEGEVDCFLLGPQYAPLRKEFGVGNRVRNETVKNIFISTGGSDKYNLTGKMLNYILDDEELQKLNYHVICGKFNVYLEELEEIEMQNSNICLYKNVTNMVDIMARCDMAVSAAGSTMYELAAMNIPSITFSFVDNQKQAALAFGDKNAAVAMGHYEVEGEEEFMHRIIGVIKELCSDEDKRFMITANASRFVDGKGAKRIATALLE